MKIARCCEDCCYREGLFCNQDGIIRDILNMKPNGFKCPLEDFTDHKQKEIKKLTKMYVTQKMPIIDMVDALNTTKSRLRKKLSKYGIKRGPQ